ncbi:GGDEF domain-containing protein [Catellatospora sp. NPDC049609]|uniref:GGDEF domain-containing protein n=1 Tax=Catellatospora sp. NPDC049609 TaxID=3155505 RepID=UPI003445FCD2
MCHTTTLLGLLTLAVLGGWAAGRRQRKALVGRLRQRDEQLWRARHLDALTGLPNRADAETRIAAMLGSRRPVCVAFADLDRFKQLNHDHGHATGDRALRHIAAVLRTLAPGTAVWRLHGDEFVFAWPASLDDSLVNAEHLRHLIASTPMPLPDGTTLTLSMSIGVAEHRPGMDLSLLPHQADLAMHDAKDRNAGCAAYDPARGAATVADRPFARARDRRHDRAAAEPESAH